MTATSVHGVPITPRLAAACRELLAGLASAEAWRELAPLIAESARRYTGVSPESDVEGKRHPPFGELYTVEAPPLHALASCALGTACARCSAPIEDHAGHRGEDRGWRTLGWWPEPSCSAMEQVLTVDRLAVSFAELVCWVFGAPKTPPAELHGEELDDGWCCTPCAARQRACEAYRRRAATWFRRWTVPEKYVGQQGLFGVEPARARRRRR